MPRGQQARSRLDVRHAVAGIAIRTLIVEMHVDLAFADFDLEYPDVVVGARPALPVANVEHGAMQRTFDDMSFEKPGGKQRERMRTDVVRCEDFVVDHVERDALVVTDLEAQRLPFG